MHPSKRLDLHPRSPRIDSRQCRALSHCCGAPILPSGLCLDCHEHCLEPVDGARFLRQGCTCFTLEDHLEFIHLDRPGLSFFDEAHPDALEEVSEMLGAVPLG